VFSEKTARLNSINILFITDFFLFYCFVGKTWGKMQEFPEIPAAGNLLSFLVNIQFVNALKKSGKCYQIKMKCDEIIYDNGLDELDDGFFFSLFKKDCCGL
jgi:hypothetical protein